MEDSRVGHETVTGIRTPFCSHGHREAQVHSLGAAEFAWGRRTRGRNRCGVEIDPLVSLPSGGQGRPEKSHSNGGDRRLIWRRRRLRPGRFGGSRRTIRAQRLLSTRRKVGFARVSGERRRLRQVKLPHGRPTALAGLQRKNGRSCCSCWGAACHPVIGSSASLRTKIAVRRYFHRAGRTRGLPMTSDAITH